MVVNYIMVSRTVTITNDTGLHTRPGNEFVNMAKSFASTIDVANDSGTKVKGTSLLKLLSLGIKKGMNVTVYVDGPDENEAIEKLSELLKNLKD